MNIITKSLIIELVINIKGGAWYSYDSGSWLDEVEDTPEGYFNDTSARGICNHFNKNL